MTVLQRRQWKTLGSENNLPERREGVKNPQRTRAYVHLEAAQGTRGWSSDPALETLLPQPPTQVDVKEKRTSSVRASSGSRVRGLAWPLHGWSSSSERRVKVRKRNNPTGVSDERTGKQRRRRGDAKGMR